MNLLETILVFMSSKSSPLSAEELVSDYCLTAACLGFSLKGQSLKSVETESSEMLPSSSRPMS